MLFCAQIVCDMDDTIKPWRDARYAKRPSMYPGVLLVRAVAEARRRLIREPAQVQSLVLL